MITPSSRWITSILALAISSPVFAQASSSSSSGGDNPCVGPQVYFGDNWTESHYAPNGMQREWFFPDWSGDYDVACIPNGDNDTHADPTIWSKNDCSIGCRRLEFTIKGRNDDGDSIGFTLGFCDGDEADPNADYLAVIWNGGDTQTTALPGSCAGAGTRPSGLSLVRVFGTPDPQEFWSQTNLDLPCSDLNSGVEVLEEGTESGWPAGSPQDITVEILPDNLKVWIEGSLEIDRDGDYVPYLQGCFGYYNQSQFADYWGLEVTPLNPVNADAMNYGDGLAGCTGVPVLSTQQAPVLGTTIPLQLGDENSQSSMCCIIASAAPDDIFFDFIGGSILVELPVLVELLVEVPDGGTVVDCPIMDDSCAAGVCVYLQLICLDDCAPGSLALSQGLKLTLGDYAP